MTMALATSCWAERSSMNPSTQIATSLNTGLEELDLALLAEDALPALGDREPRQLRPHALEHEARRVLQDRRQDAGRRQHHHRGHQQAQRSMPMAWNRPTASALFSSDQPPGLSISRAATS